MSEKSEKNDLFKLHLLLEVATINAELSKEEVKTLIKDPCLVDEVVSLLRMRAEGETKSLSYVASVIRSYGQSHEEIVRKKK